MNKKANAQMIVIIALVVILFAFAGGILTFQDGELVIPFIKQNYLHQLDYDSNISYPADLELTIFIKNPTQSAINPEIEIIYDDGWSTSNRYVRTNDKIPVGILQSNQIEKYSIEFRPSYNLRNTNQIFKINLYVDDKLIDDEKVEVYVSN